jgi:pyruvate, water dikinase
MRKISDIFSVFNTARQKGAKQNQLTDLLRIKYSSFQNLLRENNRVLGLMADMEEKLSGEYLFDREYIETNTRLVVQSVRKLIQYINDLTGNKYDLLSDIHNEISQELERILDRKFRVPVAEIAIPLERLDRESLMIAGGKIAHLGEICNHLQLPVPEGFVISSYAFKLFMEHNGLTQQIQERIKDLDVKDTVTLDSVSKEIRTMVMNASIPEEIRQSVESAVIELGLKFQIAEARACDLQFSVRSSALNEDGEFSFAGQYATFLNVGKEKVLQKYIEVVASLFTPRAIFYFRTKGFAEDEMVMAVGVLRMINAMSGGVLYTRDPNNPENQTAILNAVWGLGKAVVDGTESAQTFLLSRDNTEVVGRTIPEQSKMMSCSRSGEVVEHPVPDSLRGQPCIEENQLRELLNYGLTLEKYYGSPQDIEWVIDRKGRLFILQSRPLKLSALSSGEKTPEINGYRLLLERGITGCRGIAFGKAFVLKNEADLKQFPEGAVLVARHTSTLFVTIMDRAAGIITDIGSTTGHMASLAREYQIPAILDTVEATRIIRNGQEITVDAISCKVYEGRVNELLTYGVERQEPFRDTHLFRTLELLLKLITPLNLIDPDRENFRPENCDTFHDITRFIHEKAMAEIFKTGKGEDIDSFESIMSAITFAEAGEAKRLGSQTSVLQAGIPMDAHLLDIDGGLRKKKSKAVPDDVVSVPFRAFLKGLQVMPWPRLKPAEAKGHPGMLARAVSSEDGEQGEMITRSYAIISKNYMNFSIRLGYHFSLVEAYAGEQMNDNYIKFFFKGGGAASDRRLRRVRLISEILRKMDFKVKMTKDVMDAMVTKYRQNEIEERLEIMGKLTAYTKQLDMVMFNDPVADMFIDDFVKDHMKAFTDN